MKFFSRSKPETAGESPAAAMVDMAQQSSPVATMEEAPPPAVPKHELPPPLPPLDLSLPPNYTLNQILTRLVEMNGSDLHLEAGCTPVVRLKGDMRFTTLPVY